MHQGASNTGSMVDLGRPTPNRSLSSPDTCTNLGLQSAASTYVTTTRNPPQNDGRATNISNKRHSVNIVPQAHPIAAPPRPPRHPARSAAHANGRACPKNAGKVRPSTATGTREEVTPWELYPPPTDDIEVKLMTRSKPWQGMSLPTQQHRHTSGTASSADSHAPVSSSNMSIADFVLRRRKSSGSKKAPNRLSKPRSNTIPQVIQAHDHSLPSPQVSQFPRRSETAAAQSAPSTPRIHPQPVPKRVEPSHSAYHTILPSVNALYASTSVLSITPITLPSSHTPLTNPLTLSSPPPQTPPSKDLKFSTADRTILEELKRSIHAKASQFIIKGGQLAGSRGRGSGIGTWGVGGRHHPYSKEEVAYPRSYEREVLDFDVWETVFCQQLCNSITWHVFDKPPTKVLDLGCGTGTWILDCARQWRDCHFVGLDIVPLHPDLQQVGSPDLASRITWVQANFLEGLPFPNEEFDFVHVKRIARGVPEDKWDILLEEICRVMKPGAAFEMMEEDLFFPGKPIDDEGSNSLDDGVAANRDSHELDRDKSLHTNEEVSLHSGSGSASHGSDAPATPTTGTGNGVNVGIAESDEADDLTPRSEIPSVPQFSRPQLQVKTSPPLSQFQFPDSAISLLGASEYGSSMEYKPRYATSLSPTAFAASPAAAAILEQNGKRRPPPLALQEKSPMLKTSPKPPMNPRDHSLLELIYNEMHASRFINLAPISLLTNALGLYFKDLRTHPPLQFTFPPVSTRKPRSVASDSDSEEDEPMGHRRRATDLGWITVKNLIVGDSKYVSLDDSHFSAFSPSTKASFTPSTRQGRSAAVAASLKSRLPNTTLNLDLRTLNLHLALRTAEIFACAEAMWEWVLEFQAHAQRRPHGVPGEMWEGVLVELTREDFDGLLSRFDMDMRERMGLESVLEDRFGWGTMPTAPSSERKMFDAACARWTEWRRGAEGGYIGSDSHRRLSRVMRVFVAWKA